MSSWICSRCGADAWPAPARPSLDERFAVGYCNRCAPQPDAPPDPRAKPVAPRTVSLVRSDKWDPETLQRERERRADKKLLSDYRDGKLDRESDRIRARTVLARWEAEASR